MTDATIELLDCGRCGAMILADVPDIRHSVDALLDALGWGYNLCPVCKREMARADDRQRAAACHQGRQIANRKARAA